MSENDKAAKERRDVTVIDKDGFRLYGFHGSVYGDCLHRMEMSLRNPGVNPSREGNEFQQNNFSKGHRAEEWVKDQLRASGWIVRGGGTNWKDQITTSMFASVNDATDNPKDRLYISNHLDGHIRRVTRSGLQVRRLECKNLGEKGWKVRDTLFEVIQQYGWQVSSAAWGNERDEKGDCRSEPYPVLLVVTHKDHYDEQLWDKENKCWVPNELPREERFFQQLIEAPPYSAEECFERCRTVLRNVKHGIETPCDAYYPCVWKAWQRDIDTKTVDDADLKQAVYDFDACRAGVTHQELMLGLARVKLDEELERCGIGRGDVAVVGEYKVSISTRGALSVRSLTTSRKDNDNDADAPSEPS